MQKLILFFLASTPLFAEIGFHLDSGDDQKACVSNENATHSYRVPSAHPFEYSIELPKTDFDPDLTKKMIASRKISNLEE